MIIYLISKAIKNELDEIEVEKTIELSKEEFFYLLNIYLWPKIEKIKVSLDINNKLEELL